MKAILDGVVTPLGPQTLLPDATLAALGVGTAGINIFKSNGPGAIRYMRLNADNTITWLTDAEFVAAIGAGTGGTGDTVVVDHLTSESATSALSANQGRVLDTSKLPNPWVLELLPTEDETIPLDPSPNDILVLLNFDDPLQKLTLDLSPVLMNPDGSTLAVRRTLYFKSAVASLKVRQVPYMVHIVDRRVEAGTVITIVPSFYSAMGGEMGHPPQWGELPVATWQTLAGDKVTTTRVSMDGTFEQDFIATLDETLMVEVWESGLTLTTKLPSNVESVEGQRKWVAVDSSTTMKVYSKHNNSGLLLLRTGSMTDYEVWEFVFSGGLWHAVGLGGGSGGAGGTGDALKANNLDQFAGVTQEPGSSISISGIANIDQNLGLASNPTFNGLYLTNGDLTVAGEDSEFVHGGNTVTLTRPDTWRQALQVAPATYQAAESATIAVGGIYAGYPLQNKTIEKILHDMLVVYQTPYFASFGIHQDFTGLVYVNGGLLEVGTFFDYDFIFTWGVANYQNMKANSIRLIHEVPVNATIAVGLPVGTNGNGSSQQEAMYPWGDQLTTAGKRFAVTGVDTKTGGTVRGQFDMGATYPWFYGKSTNGVKPVIDQALINSGIKVVADSKGNILVPYGSLAGGWPEPAATDWNWFAVPAAPHGAAKTRWYIDALNNGAIGGASNLFDGSSLVNVASSVQLWSGITYYVYVANYQTAMANCEMRNS